MNPKDQVCRMEVDNLALPCSDETAMRVPYIVIHNNEDPDDMYCLHTGRSCSHENLAEELPLSPTSTIVGGGLLSLDRHGDTWNMTMATGSYKGSIPPWMQDHFAMQIKQTLALKGMQVDTIETVASNGNMNRHWSR
ncbi:MAG: hypothetical protein KBD00_00480 [Candidatus Peribacteraceae bacterium]|nr:hypothetical protein [Candidatus Peribacteraceae bacterium]